MLHVTYYTLHSCTCVSQAYRYVYWRELRLRANLLLLFPSADSERLLASARTSTVVLDRTLRAAAEAVGGVPPDLVARFKGSLNRAFHNIQAS